MRCPRCRGNHTDSGGCYDCGLRWGNSMSMMTKIKYCPVCANRLEKHGMSDYYCGVCMAILHISIQITRADSPLLDNPQENE